MQSPYQNDRGVGGNWGPPGGMAGLIAQDREIATEGRNGLAQLGEALKQFKKDKQEAQFLDAMGPRLLDAAQKAGVVVDPDEVKKFASASLGAKRGIVSGLAAQIDAAQRNAEAQRQGQMDALRAQQIQQALQESSSRMDRDRRAEAGAAQFLRGYSQPPVAESGVNADRLRALASVLPGLTAVSQTNDRLAAQPANPVMAGLGAVSPENFGAAAPDIARLAELMGRQNGGEQTFFQRGDTPAEVVPGWMQIVTGPSTSQLVPKAGAFNAADLPSVPGYAPAPTGKGGVAWLKTPDAPTGSLVPATDAKGQILTGIYLDANGRVHDFRSQMQKFTGAEPAAGNPSAPAAAANAPAGLRVEWRDGKLHWIQ